MLTLAQLEQEGDKVADLYAELQQQMFLMMIDATDKQRDLLQDRKNVALWRLRCLANMRALTADVVKAVAHKPHTWRSVSYNSLFKIMACRLPMTLIAN